MRSSLRVLVAACAAALTVSAAQAATVSFTPAGYLTGYHNGTYGRTGAIIGTMSPGASLLSHPLVDAFTGSPVPFTFCVELEQGLPAGPSSNYNVLDPASAAYSGTSGPNNWGSATPAKTNVQISNDVDRLMGFAFSVLGNNGPTTNVGEDLAALQLALWNVIYDVDLNVLGGSFFVTADPPTVTARANVLLAGISGFTATKHYHVASDPEHQDVLVEVPEPGTLALAGLALFALTWGRPRRAA